MAKNYILLCWLILISPFAGAAELDSLKGLVDQLPPDTTKVKVYNRIAYLLRGNDAVLGLTYLDKSLSLADSLGFKKGKAEALGFSSVLLNQTGNYKKSLEDALDALKLNEELGNLAGQAFSYNLIGNVYFQQKSYEQALEYYHKSLEINLKIENFEEMAKNYNNLGIAYRNKGDNTKSLEYNTKAIELNERMGNKRLLAGNYNNMGIILQNEKRLAEALEFYLKAEAINRELNTLPSLTLNLNNIGRIKTELGQLAEAWKFLEEAGKLCLKISNRQQLLSNYQHKAAWYEANGEFKKSTEYYKLNLALKDSIFTTESAEQIARMQTVYDTEKKEKENELLKKDNDLQRQTIQNQTIITVSTGLGLILLLLVIVVVYRGRQKEKRANILLSEQSQAIQGQNEELQQQRDEILAINDQLGVQKQHLEEAFKVIERKNFQLTSGIRSAQTVQAAMLSGGKAIQQHLPESFIFFKPKDIVSGDFYWFAQRDGFTFAAAVDCTGHGVHGAFIALAAHDLLNKIVLMLGELEPDTILEKLHDEVKNTFRQDETGNDDGMDIALCRIDPKTKQLIFSGAKSPLLIVKDGKWEEIKGTSRHIGKVFSKKTKPFERHELAWASGMQLFMFSDGFADQFGTPQKKKFGKNEFYALLANMASLPASEQETTLETTFTTWMDNGQNEQLDDVLVLGLKG